MSYVRTEEIKKKQSNTMKRLNKRGLIDHNAASKKQRETLAKKRQLGGRLGRRSKEDGGSYFRGGEDRPCPVCGVAVYYTPKELRENKRKCCSQDCRYADPVWREMLKNIDRSYMQTEEYSKKQSKDETPAYRRY